MKNIETLYMPELKTAEERALWFIQSAIIELMKVTDETAQNQHDIKNAARCDVLDDLRAACDALEYCAEV